VSRLLLFLPPTMYNETLYRSQAVSERMFPSGTGFCFKSTADLNLESGAFLQFWINRPRPLATRYLTGTYRQPLCWSVAVLMWGMCKASCVYSPSQVRNSFYIRTFRCVHIGGREKHASISQSYADCARTELAGNATAHHIGVDVFCCSALLSRVAFLPPKRLNEFQPYVLFWKLENSVTLLGIEPATPGL
jgi:hypothetical protein